LWAGLPGFEGAGAVAGVLSGRLNPSGKLPFSYPAHPGHFTPYHHKPQDKSTALYPFGHGLSYSQVDYSGLDVDGDAVSVTVANSGPKRAREVVLFYLTDEVGSVTRPVKRLIDYRSVWLDPGQSETVSTRLKREQFGFPRENGEMLFEPGRHTLRVGGLENELEFDGKSVLPATR
jgi:beta-glucosidase